MSGFRTHMLIGSVGGLGVAKALSSTQVLSVSTTAYGASQFGAPYIPLGLLGVGIMLSSAALATWPDIDEPGSWPSRRLKSTITLITTPIAGVIGYALAVQGYVAQRPEITAGVGILIGAALLGPLLGWLVLRLIRLGAGGHRRLTHSALLGALFAGLAFALWRNGQPVWALVPAALAYGQALHNLGDLVTPAGVPLLYPLSSRDVGLPRPFSQFGETLVTIIAIGVGYWLLWSPA